eukprot:scaffold258299_cov50-Prasinocladus_malaysianus.AAC.1
MAGGKGLSCSIFTCTIHFKVRCSRILLLIIKGQPVHALYNVTTIAAHSGGSSAALDIMWQHHYSIK